MEGKDLLCGGKSGWGKVLILKNECLLKGRQKIVAGKTGGGGRKGMPKLREKSYVP